MINREFSSQIASYLLMALGLWLVLTHGLLAALLSGMLVYSLVTIFSPRLYMRFGDTNSRLIIVSILGTIIVTALVMLIWSGIAFFKSEQGSAEALLQNWRILLMPHATSARNGSALIFPTAPTN